VPDVPSGAGGKLLEVEFCATEDKRLRNQLRDANSIEAQVTALQVGTDARWFQGLCSPQQGICIVACGMRPTSSPLG
jgi:hypothetical protein